MSPNFDNPCIGTLWEGDTAFLNTNDVPATIELINQTGSNAVPTGTQFTVQPHSGASHYQQFGLGKLPFPSEPLFINEFDVPDGVLVEGRLEIGATDCSKPVQRFGPYNGKAESPVFRSLTPAGVLQRHLGTDLASQVARVNVGVFNAGTVVANAHIETRRVVDDKLLDQRDIQVQPNSVAQVSLSGLANLTLGPSEAPNPPQIGFWVAYTTVMVDQPSLSFASVLGTENGATVGHWYVPYTIIQSTDQ